MSSFSHFVRSLAIADGSGESVHHGRRQNRVLHTDGHEALTLPLTLQPCPGLARYFGTIGIGVLGKKFRKSADAGLVLNVRKRCIVRSLFFSCQVRAGPAQQSPRRKIGIVPAPLPPGNETVTQGRFAGTQCSVHHQQSRVAMREFHRQRKAEDAAPVLTNQCQVGQFQSRCEGQQHVSVKAEGVSLFFSWLV